MFYKAPYRKGERRMKSIIKDYFSDIVGFLVFLAMLYAAFEQNYTVIQAYGVALILGVIASLVAADFAKRF